MKIREACSGDNKQLLSLTSQNAMEGTISLRIDRHPDFFSLLRERGLSITYVAENNHKLEGCFSCSETTVFINREPIRIHYLSDLKVDSNRLGSVVAFRLCQQMKKFLEANQANLLMCTVANGNYRMNPLLEGRLGLPKFECLETFKVFQFLPSRQSAKNDGIEVEEISFTEELKGLFNSFYAKYQLGKIVTHDNFLGSLHVAREKGKIVAAISLFDSSELKQNVIVRVNPFLRTLLAISKILPMTSLPSEGEEVKTVYVNNFYCAQGHEEALKVLINVARQIAMARQYHFVSLGINTKDPLIKVFDRFLKFTFRSNACIATLKNDEHLMNSIISGIPFEDYSLV